MIVYESQLKNRLHNELLHEIVPVILQHDDSNSMYNSIENRSPYLDRDLLDFSLTKSSTTSLLKIIQLPEENGKSL